MAEKLGTKRGSDGLTASKKSQNKTGSKDGTAGYNQQMCPNSECACLEVRELRSLT